MFFILYNTERVRHPSEDQDHQDHSPPFLSSSSPSLPSLSSPRSSPLSYFTTQSVYDILLSMWEYHHYLPLSLTIIIIKLFFIFHTTECVRHPPEDEGRQLRHRLRRDPQGGRHPHHRHHRHNLPDNLDLILSLSHSFKQEQGYH